MWFDLIARLRDLGDIACVHGYFEDSPAGELGGYDGKQRIGVSEYLRMHLFHYTMTLHPVSIRFI